MFGFGFGFMHFQYNQVINKIQLQPFQIIFVIILYSKVLLTLLLLIILFVLLVKFRKILFILFQIIIQRNMIHSKNLSAKSPKCTKTDKFRQFHFFVHGN